MKKKKHQSNVYFDGNVHKILGERSLSAVCSEIIRTNMKKGPRGSVVVKALCYKLEGRGFDTRWGDFF
jgi:hypothetical protein